MENTGERILLEKETPLMIARHFIAYEFARSYVIGKNVLDIGCGEGYGSNYLAEYASKVWALDYDSGVVDYAKSKYAKGNLEYLVMDAGKLAQLGHKFDVACSFQNIEHINDDIKYVYSVSEILSERGVFICSTCNRRDSSPGSLAPLNKFHVREYLLDEFKLLLKQAFTEVEIFGVKRSPRLDFYRKLKKTGILNFIPNNINPVKNYYNNINTEDFIITKRNLESALDFIAVCRK